MKWRAKQFGDTRCKTRFLLFPKCIEGEWRWLVVATWHEEVVGGYLIGDLVWAGQFWIDVVEE